MKSLTKTLAIAAVSLVAAVTVHAQEAKAPDPVLSGSDMSQRAAAFDTQIQDDAQHMLHLQAVARKEKDVVKLTCVNDRLVELKAQRNLFDTNRQQFDAALSNNADAARPHYVELGTTAETVKKLRGEAEACVGVPELYKQESDVLVTHPDFPDDPTNDDPFMPEIEAPAYASPFS